MSLVLAACTGSIGDQGPGDGISDPGVGIGDPGVGAGTCALSPGRVVLQRLTRAEYNRTVRDLFGVTSSPATAFPPDSATSGFDNNAQSLTASPQLVGLLLDAAELVAGEALKNKRNEILICDPALAGRDACARTILSALALRVYRHPASGAEIDALMKSMQFAETEGDSFETGVGDALQAMLMSPQFLYRGIPKDAPVGQNAGPIAMLDDHALATRLSYFLWGSTPDDQLLRRAGNGALRDPSSLRAEFDRLLVDAKAAALYDGFFTQWLALGKLGSASPNVQLFPVFTEALRQQMADESRLFFDDIRKRDGSALEFVTGTRTFANEAIAGIYGVPGIRGPALRPIDTDPNRRAGVLTMPAVLTMTSGPDKPNVVRRGVWLAESILCAAPPPPPQGVPPPPQPVAGETERQRLERHRVNPTCATCHDLIDPLGFAFENYDAIGNWRDNVNNQPVDNLGKLPDGRTFAGVVELARLLESGAEYPACVTQKLMTYALGRTFTAEEHCLLSAIGQRTVKGDSKLSELLWAVATSDAFQKQDIGGGQ